ncbi:MAG TPA: hypothetical protein PLT76_07685 [Candidatus Omnitrophota bacterium]|nr:hypothetical protein [Candidatus Omnitrophota bacterium]HQO58586.1 hypothetical protein [Candidatus Omnitrophota bacterium]HQP11598.1 hypothetical protein [Candidatus Omnitrophota bacterium]
MKLKSLIKIVVPGVLLLALILFPAFQHQTKSTEVGVRVIKWSPFVKKGVMRKVYAPPGPNIFFRRSSTPGMFLTPSCRILK